MSGTLGISPNMNSGTLGKLPVGTIAQQVLGTNGSNVSLTNTTTYEEIVSVSITPKYKTSKMYIHAHFNNRESDNIGASWVVCKVERCASGEALNAGTNIDTEMYIHDANGLNFDDSIFGFSHVLIDTDHSAETAYPLTYRYAAHPNYSGTWTAQRASGIAVFEIVPGK